MNPALFSCPGYKGFCFLNARHRAEADATVKRITVSQSAVADDVVEPAPSVLLFPARPLQHKQCSRGVAVHTSDTFLSPFTFTAPMAKVPLVTQLHLPDDDTLVLTVNHHVPVHVVRQRVDVRRVLILSLRE